jgi:membrane-associated protease RseP (regulator of RpoE activity)
MTQTTEPTAPPNGEHPPAPPTPEERRRSLLPLALTVAAVLWIAISGALPTVLVVVALLVMIMLHEFGHFMTAKWADMKVTEYFLGFGPRLWSFRRGETEYGIKAIPAGGYVKIIGMNNLEQVDPADEPRTYRQKPYWRRMSVAFAGSAMHFLIALVLLWSLNAFVGLVDYNAPTLDVGSLTKLETGEAPAVQAGLEVGDRVVSLDGRRVKDFDELRDYVRNRPGEPIDFVLERDGKRIERTITPLDLSKVRIAGERRPVADEPYGFIGVGTAFQIDKANPLVAVGRAGSDLWDYSITSVKALGSFFTPSNLNDYSRELTGRAAPPTASSADSGENGNRFLSPVGFVRVASQAADTGIRQVLLLLVLIIVFVGIFNLVPLPPLDGGHVAIGTYEKIRSMISGRRYQADVSKLMPIAVAVVMVFIVIGVSSLWLDIFKPLSNPFQ